MSADASAAVTAIATCVLAITAIGAFIFAALAWRGQRTQLAALNDELAGQGRQLAIQAEQLELAREDSRHLRTPVLQAEVSSIGQGVPNFRLDVRLVSGEPLARIQVTIAEARGNDCPLGFTPGQTGVEQNPGQDQLPPGWRNDPLRHEAGWDEPLPAGGAATWQMAFRDQLRRQGAGPEDIRLRAVCTAAEGDKPWHVSIPVTLSDEALQELRQLTEPDPTKTVW
jgi:hypothetical protein